MVRPSTATILLISLIEFQAEFECFRVDGDISNETERVSNVCPLHLDMTTTSRS